MKTGALIIASGDYGEGQQDNEGIPVFLPMYPLDGTTVIKGEIAKLRKAKISPILVLTGCHSETLQLHLSHNNVIIIEDENYQMHSFTDALALGLLQAKEQMDRVLVLPVEYPAFADKTLEQLLVCEHSAVPVYEEQPGWPRSIVMDADLDEQQNVEDLWTQSNIEHLFANDPGITYSLLEENGVDHISQYLKDRWNATTLHFRNKLVISREEDFFGPGVYDLLKYIDETGSIQAAVAKMNMSYSKGWKIINRAEKELGFRFLNRCNGGKNGGSSTITPEGRVFMERYHAMVEDMRRMTQNFFDVYFGEFQ